MCVISAVSSSPSSSPSALTVTVCLVAQSLFVNVSDSGLTVTSSSPLTAISTVTSSVGSLVSTTV